MRISVLLSSMLIMVLLTACSSSNESSTTDKKSNEASTEEKNESVEVDKGLLSVEVTLPASMFEGEDIDTTISEVQEDGIEVKKNEDGSLTYKMSKSKHREMVNEIETGIIESIEDMKNNEDFVSIQDITYNDSFSEFTIIADKETYENSMDSFVVFGLGLSGMYYQLFNGTDAEDYKVKIQVKDEVTEEILDEVVYPDAWEEEA